MGFFHRLLTAAPGPVERNPDDPRWWGSAAVQSDAGIPVTPDSAQEIAAVWASVTVISQGLAAMPFILYRRLPGGGKERAVEHPRYQLLHMQPNNFQTIFEWIDMMTAHALLRGNAYSQIVPGPRGAVDQLIPLHPARVTPRWGRNHTILYDVIERDGEKRTLLADEVFHLRGRSMDGLTGLSVVAHARHSMGLSRAAERFGSKMFANGARPGGVLKHPSNLSDAAQKRLIAQLDDEHGGSGNAGKTLVLEEGLDWM